MIFVKILSSALFLIIIAGLGYFALNDVPIKQSEKIETFSASQLQSIESSPSQN